MPRSPRTTKLPPRSHKARLNTQTAFMTGKIKVTGNLAVLMMNQNIISQWGSAGETLDVDY